MSKKRSPGDGSGRPSRPRFWLDLALPVGAAGREQLVEDAILCLALHLEASLIVNLRQRVGVDAVDLPQER